MVAEFFDVRDEVPGRVVFERSVRQAAAAAALLEKDYSICFWIEEPPVLGNQARAWTTVQEDNGLSVRIAALLVVEVVNV
jgi:hypothetical protein